jgi:hypothetical protein
MHATLVVLAAGLSSRFGQGNGKKIVAEVGYNGEVICDFSVYDAIQAGFDKIVYVIKEEKQTEFIEKVSSKVKGAQIVHVYQDLHDLPPGFDLPLGRTKPWGTSHALWAARHAVNEPFMVISADDFLGRQIFFDMYSFLNELKSDSAHTFAMPGHLLGETVSEHGSVSRAICDVDDFGYVVDIRETKGIKKRNGDIGHCLGEDFKLLDANSIVNMLAFAFTPAIFAEIENYFGEFYRQYAHDIEAEYYLNSVVRNLIARARATLKTLPVSRKDRWIGMTYEDDLGPVQQAVRKLIDNGQYPPKLFVT